MSEGHISLAIYSNPNFLPVNTIDQEVQGLLVLQPPPASTQSLVGTDIVLLLDSSGSMDDSYYNTGISKRQAVVEALGSMLQELQDADTLTVVSFNTIATVLLDHQRKSANTLIEQSIQNYFQQYGETNFEAAMNVAFGVCQKKVNPVKKIIFLTDGNPWGGNTNNALSIASRIANEGLATLDAMGIGGDFNFDLMRQFSAPSGGITENIVNTNDARNVFRQILRSSQHTIASNIQMQMLFGTHVRDVEIYQSAPEKRSLVPKSTTAPNGTFYQLFLGDLTEGSPKQYVICCRADLPDSSFVKLADIIINYRIPQSGETLQSKLEWNLNLASDASQIFYDSFVSNCFREIELLIGLEQALKLYERNCISEALKKLNSLIKYADELGDMEQKQMLHENYNKILNNEKLTQADLNRMLHRSSRSSRVRTQVKNKPKL